MKINAALSKIDASRYTVYQALDYVKTSAGLELIQKKTNNLFLFKTRPFIDSLYNYAHVLSDKFDERDMISLKEFFGADKFRIKIPDNDNIKAILSAHGFKLKKADIIMAVKDLPGRNYDFSLPENIEILPADNQVILGQAKLIFSEAFDCSPEDCRRKFGFLDKAMLDDEAHHLKTFVLYENGQPVSTGAYYAFDNFSLENIGTIRSARGRGYAGFIVRTLLQAAQKFNYAEACLSASESGARVYEKNGFEALLKTNTYI